MNKVLATDLDGTLFYPKQKHRYISKANLAFIRRWIDEGNRLVLVTSRSEEFLKGVVKEIDRPVDLIVCNSSQIIANGEVIRDVPIPNKTMMNIMEKINKRYHPTAYLMTTNHYPCLIKNVSVTGNLLMAFYNLWWKFQGMYREPFTLSNKIFEKEVNGNGLIYKNMIFFGLGRGKAKFSKDLNKVFREEFPNVEFSWVGKVIEITPKDCSKGAGLMYYCENLKIDPSNVYVIGDSGNDISMFNLFKDNSFCMKHSNKVVKKYAKMIVKNVASLEKILLVKGEKTNEPN